MGKTKAKKSKRLLLCRCLCLFRDAWRCLCRCREATKNSCGCLVIWYYRLRCHVLRRFWRPIFIRLSIIIHCILAAWRVTVLREETTYWLLCLLILPFIAEAFFVNRLKKITDKFGINLCFILYLSSIVPSIWLLETGRLQRIYVSENIEHTLSKVNDNTVGSLSRQKRFVEDGTTPTTLPSNASSTHNLYPGTTITPPTNNGTHSGVYVKSNRSETGSQSTIFKVLLRTVKITTPYTRLSALMHSDGVHGNTVTHSYDSSINKTVSNPEIIPTKPIQTLLSKILTTGISTNEEFLKLGNTEKTPTQTATMQTISPGTETDKNTILSSTTRETLLDKTMDTLVSTQTQRKTTVSTTDHLPFHETEEKSITVSTTTTELPSNTITNHAFNTNTALTTSVGDVAQKGTKRTLTTTPSIVTNSLLNILGTTNLKTKKPLSNMTPTLSTVRNHTLSNGDSASVGTLSTRGDQDATLSLSGFGTTSDVENVTKDYQITGIHAIIDQVNNTTEENLDNISDTDKASIKTTTSTVKEWLSKSLGTTRSPHRTTTESSSNVKQSSSTVAVSATLSSRSSAFINVTPPTTTSEDEQNVTKLPAYVSTINIDNGTSEYQINATKAVSDVNITTTDEILVNERNTTQAQQTSIGTSPSSRDMSFAGISPTSEVSTGWASTEKITHGGVINKIKDSFTIHIISDSWTMALQSVLIFILFTARWLLPRGTMTRLELSNLLAEFLANGMDIMEFFNLFEYSIIITDRVLTYFILTSWTLSLVQYVIVFKKEHLRHQELKDPTRKEKIIASLRETIDITFGIIVQDLPFFILRTYALCKYSVYSVTVVFFLMKNALIVLLCVYRMMIRLLPSWKKETSEKDNSKNTIGRANKYAKPINRALNDVKKQPPNRNNKDRRGNIPVGRMVPGGIGTKFKVMKAMCCV